jgi:hypothetical protein
MEEIMELVPARQADRTSDNTSPMTFAVSPLSRLVVYLRVMPVT